MQSQSPRKLGHPMYIICHNDSLKNKKKSQLIQPEPKRRLILLRPLYANCIHICICIIYLPHILASGLMHFAYNNYIQLAAAPHCQFVTLARSPPTSGEQVNLLAQWAPRPLDNARAQVSLDLLANCECFSECGAFRCGSIGLFCLLRFRLFRIRAFYSRIVYVTRVIFDFVYESVISQNSTWYIKLK